MKLDQLKAGYGRYLAIEERRKIDANRARREHFELVDGFVAALPGLLRVCDAFIEAETFRLNESGVWYPDEPYDVWRSGNREKAEKKLEELLG